MLAVAYRRGHVDHSFNELSFFDRRHGLVSAFELGARESIPILQRGDLVM